MRKEQDNRPALFASFIYLLSLDIDIILNKSTDSPINYSYMKENTLITDNKPKKLQLLISFGFSIISYQKI